jgi:hypothetical protein
VAKTDEEFSEWTQIESRCCPQQPHNESCGGACEWSRDALPLMPDKVHCSECPGTCRLIFATLVNVLSQHSGKNRSIGPVVKASVLLTEDPSRTLSIIFFSFLVLSGKMTEFKVVHSNWLLSLELVVMISQRPGRLPVLPVVFLPVRGVILRQIF